MAPFRTQESDAVRAHCREAIPVAYPEGLPMGKQHRGAATRSEYSNSRLSTSVLALHIIHVGSFILTLVVILAKVTHVRRSCNGREGPASTKSVRLGISHSHVPFRGTNGTADYARVIRHTTTGTGILRDDGACIAAISATFGAIGTTRDSWTKRTRRREHGQTRRVSCLGSE